MVRLVRSLVLLLLFALLSPSFGGERTELDPSFLVDRTVVRVGRTAVIPFRLSREARIDRTFEAAIRWPDRLELLRKPAVLAGHDLGYLRVRGRKTGPTTLRIGSAQIAVRVVSAPTPPAHPPRITCPAPGTTIWGTVSIGVEQFDDPVQTGEKKRIVRLRLPDGTDLAPTDDSGLVDGPTRRLRFDLDTTRLSEGPVRLVARTKTETGTWIESSPRAFVVHRPKGETLQAGECEAHRQKERPKRYRQKLPRVRKDERASGKKIVVNAGARPAWCLPVKVETAGWYALKIRARGDLAGGAFPTVGLYVDEENRPRTSARLCSAGYHWLPAGRPVHLKPGDHFLTVFFLNDFYVPKRADRNLFLDAYELVRLPKAAPQGEPPRIAITSPKQGDWVAGTLTVSGLCDWDRPKQNPAPKVTLLVDGQPMARQKTPEPYFQVDRSRLSPGLHTVSLRAVNERGQATESPAQVVIVPAIETPAPPRRFRRFDIQEPVWGGEGFKKRLTDKRRLPGHRVLAFHSNGSVHLDLPDDLAGRFNVLIEGRGQVYAGRSIARVTLEAGDKSEAVGDVKLPGGWRRLPAGTVTLKKGPKRLRVAFVNDKYDKGKGDRNLWIKAVCLREHPKTKDETPPSVRIRYPRPGQRAHGAEVVIIEGWDDRDVHWAEILLDGRPTGFRTVLNDQRGRALLPLPCRFLKPGEHRLAVRLRDRAGNMTTSEHQLLEVLDEAPAKPGPLARAVHLLNRFAHGPEARELIDCLTLGEETWLAARLGGEADDPGAAALADWCRLRFWNERSGGHIRLRVLSEWMRTDNPVRARFVAFAENHFSTWIKKTGAPAKWFEHLDFRRLGVAPFGDLLLASAESPAMLYYLDQHRSFAGRLNENYAREIMELHSLGVDGGYSQKDVTTLAHLLTGWMLAREGMKGRGGQPLRRRFRFDGALGVKKAFRILGMSFPPAGPAQRYDRVRSAIDLLARHPGTARFIVTKLVAHYVGLPASEELVRDLTVRFHETGGDLKTLLRELARHPEFWASRTKRRLTHPLDYGLRLTRIANHQNPWRLSAFLQRSGMGLYDRSTPDGYPEADQAYADSNALLQRWRLARELEWSIRTLLPWPWHNPGKRPKKRWRQTVVDCLAIRLTGGLLSPSSNEAALKVLRESKETSVRDRILAIGTFIAQLPEANLR